MWPATANATMKGSSSQVVNDARPLALRVAAWAADGLQSVANAMSAGSSRREQGLRILVTVATVTRSAPPAKRTDESTRTRAWGLADGVRIDRGAVAKMPHFLT